MTALFRNSLNLLLGRRPPAMQVGALCQDAAREKVLLITSRGTGRWIIPKGWPMAGRSLAGAALQEAWEEAGVQGEIDPTELGRYTYDKVQDRGFAIPVEVRIFKVTVARLAEDFPENDERDRQWFSPAEAGKLVAEPGLRTILRDFRG